MNFFRLTTILFTSLSMAMAFSHLLQLPPRMSFAAAALPVWILLVTPANAQIGGWPVEAMPPDWTGWRAQWEHAHAVRALLLIAALGCLMQSVIVETRASA